MELLLKNVDKPSVYLRALAASSLWALLTNNQKVSLILLFGRLFVNAPKRRHKNYDLVWNYNCNIKNNLRIEIGCCQQPTFQALSPNKLRGNKLVFLALGQEYSC